MTPESITCAGIKKNDGHTYLILFTKTNRAEALRTLGKWASDPKCSFTWYDAAVLSQKIREMTDRTDRRM